MEFQIICFKPTCLFPFIYFICSRLLVYLCGTLNSIAPKYRPPSATYMYMYNVIIKSYTINKKRMVPRIHLTSDSHPTFSNYWNSSLRTSSGIFGNVWKSSAENVFSNVGDRVTARFIFATLVMWIIQKSQAGTLYNLLHNDFNPGIR